MPTESRIRVAQVLHGVFGQESRIPDTWDADLSREDAAFANALLGLCVRRWGRLQAYVSPKLKTPDRGLPLGSQVMLAMGLAQLAWLSGVSSHGAVNEIVELTRDRAWGFPPHLGLVNAMLRAGSRDRDQLRQELDALPASLDRSPFVERVLREALAPLSQAERLEELWSSLQVPPDPIFKAVKPGPLPPGLEPVPGLPGALALAPEAAFPREWLASGSGMVQDSSSQAMMGFVWERPVRSILDVCAAPGGKTTALFLRWPQAELLCLEQHARRARRLEENLKVRGVPARIQVEEACAWLEKEGPDFDLILLDAPCSGSGTLRKHPELTWLGAGVDLERLIQIQRSLLQSAVRRLAPGGLLVYSVCSWLAAEGVEHRAGLLAGEPGLRAAAIWPGPAGGAPVEVFRPDPLNWVGEGFQAFALTRV